MKSEDSITAAIEAMVAAGALAGAATLIWRDGWPGAWGGWWQADPSDNSVLLFLAHNMVELNQFAQGVGFGVFDAIIRFQSLASSLAR